jgi:2-methylfumaryl-CoA isomerase
MYGSFGVDFTTADGRAVMVVALTETQWRALRDVTETGAVFAALEKALDANLNLETDRYRLRETVAAVLRPWFAQRDFQTVRTLLDQARVLWSPYLNMLETATAARRDPASIAEEIDQPGIGPVLATGSPLRWFGQVGPPVRAPRLGEHTDVVLHEVLGLSDADIGRLDQRAVIRTVR